MCLNFNEYLLFKNIFQISFCILKHFRQDYCRFDKDLIENLEYIDNMTHCQTACQIHEDCNFFTFLKDEHVCKLHALDFDNRVCDIIHGLPTRTFQSCLDENKIPWANSSGNRVFLNKIGFKMIKNGLSGF